MSFIDSKNFDAFVRVVDLAFKLIGIVVTVYLFRLGNEIKKEQDRFNIEQKGFDRAITLLKSFVSENPSERYLAIKYSEMLNQRDSFPDEVIIYVKDLLSKDTVSQNIEAANELLQAVNQKAEDQQDKKTLEFLNDQLSEIDPRVYIHIRDESMRRIFKDLIALLEKENFTMPGIQRVTHQYSKTELLYFKKTEREKAEEIAAILRQKAPAEAGLSDLNTRYISGYENSNKIRPFHFELWVK